MRVAVISDVHANLRALEAVLGAVDGEAPDAVWCLGDTVGYGPQPTACCELVEGRSDIALVGNHDLGALGTLELDDFQPDAAFAARWTAEQLTPEARAWLESLEPSAVTERVALFHGSPREPVWEYAFTPESVAAAIELSPRALVLVGHSHLTLAVAATERGLEGGLVSGDTTVELDQTAGWLLNPGSVGQPRDGDPRAAWLLLDLDRNRAEFHRVEYPIEQTQKEIREAGLPESLAARLASGT